jgi:hypothetical protein
MSGAKRDQSGTFSNDFVDMSSPEGAIDARSIQLNRNGVMFETDHALDQFTELGIQLQLPSKNGQNEGVVDGRGVVVDCSQVQEGRFQVSLLFTDLGADEIAPFYGEA